MFEKQNCRLARSAEKSQILVEGRWGELESADMQAFDQAIGDGSLKIDFVNEDTAALFGKPLKVIDRK